MTSRIASSGKVCVGQRISKLGQVGDRPISIESDPAPAAVQIGAEATVRVAGKIADMPDCDDVGERARRRPYSLGAGELVIKNSCR